MINELALSQLIYGVEFPAPNFKNQGDVKLPPTDVVNDVTSTDQHYPYDVALSFAGEDRIYAEALADALLHHGIKVFYDQYEKPTLWGKNLYTYLSDVYQNKARYCVMFLSQHYAAKLWTNHEREAAQARAFRENEEYILPVRLDNTEIPGILETTAYLNWYEETIDTIVNAILEKLGKPLQNLPEIGRKKITHELPAEYEKQIQQVGGMIDFRQAITARDWKQAEKVLQKYPNLPEARSSLGLSMSQEVQEYFSYQLHPSNSLVGGPVTPLYRARPTGCATRFKQASVEAESGSRWRAGRFVSY